MARCYKTHAHPKKLAFVWAVIKFRPASSLHRPFGSFLEIEDAKPEGSLICKGLSALPLPLSSLEIVTACPKVGNPKLACWRISDGDKQKHAVVEELMRDKQESTVEEIELNPEELEDVIAPGGV